jgi:hypothetical protein
VSNTFTIFCSYSISYLIGLEWIDHFSRFKVSETSMINLIDKRAANEGFTNPRFCFLNWGRKHEQLDQSLNMMSANIKVDDF